MPDAARTLDALLAGPLAHQPDATAITTVDPTAGAEQALSLHRFDTLVCR